MNCSTNGALNSEVHRGPQGCAWVLLVCSKNDNVMSVVQDLSWALWFRVLFIERGFYPENVRRHLSGSRDRFQSFIEGLNVGHRRRRYDIIIPTFSQNIPLATFSYAQIVDLTYFLGSPTRISGNSLVDAWLVLKVTYHFNIIVRDSHPTPLHPPPRWNTARVYNTVIIPLRPPFS
jgi:hypothetical protein